MSFEVLCRENVIYGPTPSETMDAFVPILPTKARSTPSMMLIPGGGWFNTNKRYFCVSTNPMGHLAKAFATKGVAAFALNYPTWNSDRARWPIIIAAVENAIRFAKDQSNGFNVDPKRCGAFGNSAGGQIASFLGVRGRVQAVVDNSGPVNLVTMPSLRTEIDTVFGSVPDQAAASPVNRIGTHSAPMFITHGIDDPLVPAWQSKEYHERLIKAGIPSVLKLYQGGHVFRRTDPDAVSLILEESIEWILLHLSKQL